MALARKHVKSKFIELERSAYVRAQKNRLFSLVSQEFLFIIRNLSKQQRFSSTLESFSSFLHFDIFFPSRKNIHFSPATNLNQIKIQCNFEANCVQMTELFQIFAGWS